MFLDVESPGTPSPVATISPSVEEEPPSTTHESEAPPAVPDHGVRKSRSGVCECADNGHAGDTMTAFGLRVKLLHLSHKLKDEDNQQVTELDVIKSFFRSKMSAEHYNKITKGYQLFAYLEDKQLISQDNLQALEAPLNACGRSGTLECLSHESRSETTAWSCPMELKSGVLANLDMEVYSATDTSKVEDLYQQCLCHVGNGIATSNGSLAELVYLCPEVPLSLMNSKTLCSPRQLFNHLEQKGLISCWKLSYLYCRLCVLGRRDLCKEVEQYASFARMHMPRINPSMERKLLKNYVRSHSEPERRDGSVFTLLKNKMSSLPASLLRLRRQGKQDVTTLHANKREQVSEAGGRREDGGENCDGPLVVHKPNSGKLALQLRGAVDEQDKSEWKREQQRERITRDGESHSACTGSPNTGDRCTTQNITVFNHKVYRYLQNVLLWNASYGLFCAVLVLVAVMIVVKFLVELSACGSGTAVLNLLGRGMTNMCIPTIIIYIMVRMAEDNCVSNMRVLSCSRESERVLNAVIQKLLSRQELENLKGMSSAVERVNFLLNSKLNLIVSVALLRTMAFFVQVLYQRAANYPHFSGIASYVAGVCTAVMGIGASFIHLVTGIAVSLYLFEMHFQEYLAYIVNTAQQLHVNTVKEAAEEAREIIFQRWRTFQTVMTFLSVVHMLLLMYSIWSSTPFHCFVDSVTFNKVELRQVPMSWLLWIFISFICHTCVYNFHSFTAALMLQMFSLLLCLLDHTSLKWVLILQITYVVYPCGSLFRICVLACRNVYLSVFFSFGSVEKGHRLHSALIWCTVLTDLRFLFHASLALAIVLIVPSAMYNEYTLLTKGVQSV